jgi:ketosteroid isomerase-like protein
MTRLLISFLFIINLTARADDKADVVAVLNAQVASWNKGDVRAFMLGYKNSDATKFVSAKGVTLGYQSVLERYLKNYPTKEKMGTLSFGDLDVKLLSATNAMVIGRWSLARPETDGGNVGGYFTLLFEKTPDGWKVIIDHTS